MNYVLRCPLVGSPIASDQKSDSKTASVSWSFFSQNRENRAAFWSQTWEGSSPVSIWWLALDTGCMAELSATQLHGAALQAGLQGIVRTHVEALLATLMENTDT